MPGVANVLHFNNAGAPLPARSVLDAVTSGVPVQDYSFV